jgi:hypothetical protein
VAERALPMPLLVLFAVLGSAFWVLRDARARADGGHRVAVDLGNVRIETPESWAIGCLLLWIFVLPLYLKARSES